MPFGTTTDPRRWQEAADYFLTRIPITKGWYEQLALKWRRYTFTVANVATLEMVAEVQASLHQAIVDNVHLQEWKRAFLPTLEAMFGGTVARPGFRASTIYRNALQRSYNTGRWLVHTDPDVMAARPYWMFDALLDDRTTDICRERDGTVREATDKFWLANYPPLHHRCRSSVRSLRRSTAEARGITEGPAANEHAVQRGFGAAPEVGEWAPDVSSMPGKLKTVYEKKAASMPQIKPPLGPAPKPPGSAYAPATEPAPVPPASAAPKPATGATPAAAKPVPESPTPAPPHAQPPKPTPKPTPDPAAAPPKTPAPSAPPLRDTIMGELVTGPKGSNAGGFYRGTDGVMRYVKAYDDRSQAWQEHLANQVYRGLGLEAPESIVFELADGRIAYASTILEGGQTLAEVSLTKARARAVMRGFTGDVLVGNWDAVGMTLDNVLLVGKKVVRIDNGGSFLMRARAGRKPTSLLEAITEWDKLFDKAVNPAYARVAKAAGYARAEDLGEALLGQIDDVLALQSKAGGWDRFVTLHAPGLEPVDRRAIVSMLERRTALLAAKRAEVEAFLEAAKKSAEQAAAAMASGAPIQLEWGSGAYAALSESSDRAAASRRWRSLYQAARKADPDAADGAVRVVSSWTAGYSEGPYQRGLRREAEALLAGGAPSTDHGRFLKRALETRAARWQAAAAKAKVPVPTSFRAYRGVSGEAFLQDVYEAWKADADVMVVRSRSMASWSMSPHGAFRAQVVYEADIPFHMTAFDQFVDDGDFLKSFFNEHEVVSITPGENILTADPRKVRVNALGRTYTYAERADFIASWEARHGVGGVRGHQSLTPPVQ